MAVFRVEKTNNYTVMSNHHLRDQSLSLKAKDLLSQMLSLPEDWDYTLTGLSQINRESKDAIRSAVKELEAAGYIERRQTTDERGKFSGNEYIIHEYPITHEPPRASGEAEDSEPERDTGAPLSENPTTDETTAEPTAPLLENPTTENPTTEPFLRHPLLENPTTGNPSTEKPSSENPTQLNKEKQN